MVPLLLVLVVVLGFVALWMALSIGDLRRHLIRTECSRDEWYKDFVRERELREKLEKKLECTQKACSVAATQLRSVSSPTVV